MVSFPAKHARSTRTHTRTFPSRVVVAPIVYRERTRLFFLSSILRNRSFDAAIETHVVCDVSPSAGETKVPVGGRAIAEKSMDLVRKARNNAGYTAMLRKQPGHFPSDFIPSSRFFKP